MVLYIASALENIDPNEHALMLKRAFKNGGHICIAKELRGQRDRRITRPEGGRDEHASWKSLLGQNPDFRSARPNGLRRRIRRLSELRMGNFEIETFTALQSREELRLR